jgi:hypothetical protein
MIENNTFYASFARKLRKLLKKIKIKIEPEKSVAAGEITAASPAL